MPPWEKGDNYPKKEEEIEKDNSSALKSKHNDDGCPFGIDFGKDWDSHNDCSNCTDEEYDICKEEYMKKRRRSRSSRNA